MNTAFRISEEKTIELAPGIVPEWETPKELVVVWPERLRIGVGKLKPFYKNFIWQLSKIADVRILVHPELEKNVILSLFENTDRIRITKLPVSDIRINDYLPFAQRPVHGKSVLKPLYAPSYLNDRNEVYSTDGNNLAIMLSELFGYTVDIPKNDCGLPLILDGSSIVFNGKDTAICTNRIIRDNESWSIEQIHEVFRKTFGINRLIILPVEPGDPSGHITNMVRFIDQETALVVEYDSGHLKSIMDHSAESLQNNGIEVIRINCTVPVYKAGQQIPSRKGNFMNFLRFGEMILLPYSDEYSREFEEASSIFREKGLSVIPVGTVEELEELGYGLNEVVWKGY